MDIISYLQDRLNLIPISEAKSAEQQERLDNLELRFEEVKRDARSVLEFERYRRNGRLRHRQ